MIYHKSHNIQIFSVINDEFSHSHWISAHKRLLMATFLLGATQSKQV